MTIVVGATIPPYKMAGDPSGWNTWLANAEAVQMSVEEPVLYFAAIEVDARGLDPFRPLTDRLYDLGGDFWTFSLDDNVDVVTTGTRLRRICTGRNLIQTYAVEETNASHVLFLDSDTECRDDVLPRLLELGVAAAASHCPTYGQDGPRSAEFPQWDVRLHMDSAGCWLLRRDVVRRLRWRFDPEAGLTDDPCYVADLADFLHEPLHVRHDVQSSHWPPSIPAIEHRYTDQERTVVRETAELGPRLNVGCGEFYADGWLNIDMTSNDKVKPDRVASVTDLPVDLRNLSAVYVGHILEHLPEDTVVTVLTRLRNRMMPGAQITAVGPDVNRAKTMLDAGVLDEETYRTCLAGAGAQRWDGDYHFWSCTEELLVRYLTEAGFRDVTALPIDDEQAFEEWPLTSAIGWQGAARGTA